METLLSHSFDYLSSQSPHKVRKGLRQVEGLLAQICLSESKSRSPQRHSLTPSVPAQLPPSTTLLELHNDPAFREFFKLQQSFQWNITMRLIGCLERLLGKESSGTMDMLVIQTLDLIQGVLLLHPPSRGLFARDIHMNLFLDLLDPSNCPAIQSSTLLALVTSLLDHPDNARTLESADGLLVVTSLFKARTTSRDVKLKLVEFLYFYLMPETQAPKAVTSATNTAVLGGRGRELVAAFDRRRETVGLVESTSKEFARTKSTEEKQALLGRYLNNVQDLVQDLREGSELFGRNI